MGTTPGRLDATTVPRVSSWNSFSFSCLCLGIFLWWCPSPLIRFALRNPWILTPFLLKALQPEISQATFFWQTFSCFTHFLTLFILPISALPTLVISLIWALLSSSHLPLPYFRYFPLRISRLFPFPAFFIRRFLTFPILSFSYSFSFPGIFWIKCCVWLGESRFGLRVQEFRVMDLWLKKSRVVEFMM